MEKTLGKEYANSVQREAFLKDNCEKAESRGYMKPFTPEQLQGHKESLANVSISIEEIQTEKKLAMDGYKGQLKPLDDQRRQMVSNIRAKAEYVTETCYRFTNRETKETGYYNAEGDLIELRPATADELQPTLFMGMQRTGTND